MKTLGLKSDETADSQVGQKYATTKSLAIEWEQPLYLAVVVRVDLKAEESEQGKWTRDTKGTFF